MKKTFNYNLKNRFKTSVLLSALGFGTLIGCVSCHDNVSVPMVKESNKEYNIKMQNSLYNDVLKYLIEVDSWNNIEGFRDFVDNFVSDSINDRYTKVSDLYSYMKNTKYKNSIVRSSCLTSKEKLLNACQVYLRFTENFERLNIKKEREEYLRNKLLNEQSR